MNLSWPFHNRRAEIISPPFPDQWSELIHQRVWQYSLLDNQEKSRLHDDLRIFMSEKNWEGALDFVVDDDVKVVVSALACLLTVAFEKHDYFPNVQTVIVYPTSYVAQSTTVDGYVVENSPEARLGEAHGNGPIILSWSDILNDSQTPSRGENLVLHEFAHKLDFRDGDANGVPPLRDSAEVDEWARVMSSEFEQLVSDVDHHRHSVLRPYGATNPAEFFAVCTESYFERPVQLEAHKQELYSVLRDYYGIDWAKRMNS